MTYENVTDENVIDRQECDPADPGSHGANSARALDIDQQVDRALQALNSAGARDLERIDYELGAFMLAAFVAVLVFIS